jgi:glutathione peroxidase
MSKLFLVTLLALVSAAPSFHDFKMKTIDGKEKSLADYKGKVVLVVNVASECGYTPQYTDLEKLYQAYKDKGLVVVGFPSNDYGGQEPGSDADIKKFCSTTYTVSFDLFSKIFTKGENKHPLYQYLTTASTPSGEVGWNFEKFLVDKNGVVIGRYKSGVKPMSDDLKGAIEKALAAK